MYNTFNNTVKPYTESHPLSLFYIQLAIRKRKTLLENSGLFNMSISLEMFAYVSHLSVLSLLFSIEKKRSKMSRDSDLNRVTN